jgi:hypothetical protein
MKTKRVVKQFTGKILTTFDGFTPRVNRKYSLLLASLANATSTIEP